MDTYANQSLSTIGPNDGQHVLAAANRTAEKIKNRWLQGDTPNLNAVLADHPELRHHRSIVLNLAYSEYNLRLQAGEPLDVEEFSRRFPSYQKSLCFLIEVHGLLSQDPALQEFNKNINWPEAGDRFLKFDLLAEIGRGAFGRVFLAEEYALGGRQIVVKVAPQAGGEAELLGRLRHPNIVPIYSLHEDTTTGLAAFCMPFLGRATLNDILDESFINGRVPEKGQDILKIIEAVNSDLDIQETQPPSSEIKRGSYVDAVIYLGCQMAEALAHAHGRGIFHRDMKPSNVLMAPDGQPLLLDFNLSVDADLPAWKIGGTLPYMPPEELAWLANKKPETSVRHYDPRSDIFSLGVIIYELLTGELPFGGIPENRSLDEVAETLYREQENGPRSIRKRNRQVDHRLARLVESCLSFKPECRPETARQLADAFQQELSIVRRGNRWIHNHRKLVACLATLALAAMLATGGYLAFRPSYSERQMQLGLAYDAQGEYTQAIGCFSEALRDNPDSGDILFARGRAYQHENKYLLAQQDYHLAFSIKKTPEIKACEGYCLSKSKIHGAAVATYEEALKANYSSPVILHNNLGYSYLMLAQFDKAEEHLQQALLLDDNLQEVHHNLLILYLQRTLQGKPIPSEAFRHAGRALEIGPCTGDLCYFVAALYALAAKQDSTLVEPAIKYIAMSVEHGIKPEKYASDVLFSALRKEPAFHEALSKSMRMEKPLNAKRVLDPLDSQ